MEKTAKPKEKRSSSRLLWATPFEYVSPYSLDDCLNRFKLLELRPVKAASKSPQIVFQLDEITDNGAVVYFNGRPSVKEMLFDVRILGQLVQVRNNTVRIKAQVGYTFASVFTFISIAVVVNLFFILNWWPLNANELLFLPLINTFVILLQLAYVRDMKRKIQQAMRETFAVSRPRTLPP